MTQVHHDSQDNKAECGRDFEHAGLHLVVLCLDGLYVFLECDLFKFLLQLRQILFVLFDSLDTPFTLD
jgi:hypothetical protein